MTARNRPCSFSKDGTEDEEDISPAVSPVIPVKRTRTNNVVATEILSRLCKSNPGQGKEGKWELNYQQLVMTRNRKLDYKQPKVDLPTKTIQQDLIQLYFKYCYPTFPIIPKRLFFKQFESSTIKLLTSPILLLIIFAHGSQYHDKLDGDVYFNQAKSLLEYEMNYPTKSTIIALTLMSLYESGINTCSTMYSAMAFQMCMDMDLFKNHGEFMELKKRICWSCYYLDKIIHLQSGKPWIIKSKDIEMDMPLLQPGDDIHEQKVLQVFTNIIKLLQIAERVLQQNQPIVSVNSDNELIHWLRSLPQQLQWTPLIIQTTPQIPDPPASQFICLVHLLYNYTELLVLKPYLSSTVKSIHQKSVAIATNLTRIIVTLLDNRDWIFNFNLVMVALFESIKIHLRDCASSNINLARHARYMFQQSMKAMKSLLKLDEKKNSITLTLTAFLTSLDQALNDANIDEDMMTPFVLGSLNPRQEEVNYFGNTLVTPPVVKSKSNLYYHPPSMMYNNNLFQSTWRATMTPDRFQYNRPLDFLASEDAKQHSQAELLSHSSDIAALVAQIQDGNTSSNTSETTNTATSTPTNNNNEDLLYSLLSDRQPEPEPPQQPQQRFTYPYTNVGLGIYASAHQHHNDVIRQHLPTSSSSAGPMTRPVVLAHQGQVIVTTNNHGP